MSNPQSKSKSRSKSPTNSTKQLKKSNKVFITNMNSLLSVSELDAKLRDMFGKLGEILDLQVKQNFQKKYSFAFLEMKDPAVIPKIIETYNGCQFEGRKLRVEHQKSNPRQWAQRNTDRDNNFYRNNRFQQSFYNNERPKFNNAYQKPSLFESKQQPKDSKPEQKLPLRKRSASQQEKGNSKRYQKRSKTPERQKTDFKKNDYRSSNQNEESLRKTDRVEKKHEKRRYSQSSSRSSSGHYRRRHESKRSYNQHDSKKSSNHRDRSNSRDRHDKSTDYKRRQKKDRQGRHIYKRSRNDKYREYSSSDSRSSSYEYRHRDKKSDKKKKTHRQNERSYSPYDRRRKFNHNN